MSPETIGTVINVLKWAYDHRKEELEATEIGIHFLRRIEHLVVKHNTTLDDLLVHADKALQDYNQQKLGSSSNSSTNSTTSF